MAGEEDRFRVRLGDDRYDIEEFLRNHPGGVNYINGYRDRDVAGRMLDTKHSKSAFYLLREYRVGGRNEQTTDFNEDLEVRRFFSTYMMMLMKALRKF